MTKKSIEQILKYYSLKGNEFQCIRDRMFENKSIKGYCINIDILLDNIVKVTHTDTTGKIKYVDVWKYDDKNIVFSSRELANAVTSEESKLFFEYQKEYYEMKYKYKSASQKVEWLEKEYEKLKVKVKDLKSQIKKDTQNNNAELLKKIAELEQENRQLKDLNTIKANVGRKKIETKDDNKGIIEDIKQGMKEQEIMQKYHIGRATYYRLKKRFKGEDTEFT